MKVLSSTEVRQNFSAVLSAINVEPIGISKQEKEIAVVMSTQRSQITPIKTRMRGFSYLYVGA